MLLPNGKSRIQDALDKADTMLASHIGPMHPVRLEIKKLMDEIAARNSSTKETTP